MKRVHAVIALAFSGGAFLLLRSPDAAGVHVPTTCPTGLPGSELVFVPGRSPFCIDAHEVKQSEYASFLQAAAQRAPAQSATCAWNKRFEPIAYSRDSEAPLGACRAGIFDPATRGDYSMTCVDWCDAKAYCEWAGKRLCGGLAGRDETLDSYKDSAASEWQHACTNAGASNYPYGSQYAAARCNDAKVRSPDRKAGSRGNAQCRGTKPPFDRISDLAGGVYEWTSACDDKGRYCSIQGGYYGDEEPSCASGGITYPRETRPDIGFRCCADAK